MRLASTTVSTLAALAIALASPVPGKTQSALMTTARAAATLSVQARREIVESIAAVAAERYSTEAGGRALAAHLRARAGSGAYDAASNPSDFVALLTADMRDAVPDVHLRAVHDPNRAPAVGRQMPASGVVSTGTPQNLARVDGRSNEAIARTNFGFQRVERLRGNVGYLKLTQFVPPDLSLDTAVAAMGFLANTDAVIIDLRGTPGGSPDLVRRLISYFMAPEPVRLMASQSRGSDAVDEIWNVADIPGRRMTGRPLYVLQDGDTASAAEMFGYFVQRQGLGTIVGVTSAGAGNGGSMVAVGYDVYVFLPQRRVIDGPGWEAVGIRPDLEALPERALEVAHLAALRRLTGMTAEDALKREREWALEYATASYGGADADLLREYGAPFDRRRFEVEGTSLVLVSSTGARQALVRVSRDVFRAESTRFTFHRGPSGRVVAVDVEPFNGAASTSRRGDVPA